MSIEVAIPNNFIPERKYAIHVLFDTLLGLDYEVFPRVGIKDYVIKLENGKKIIIQDYFFSSFDETVGYLDKANLPSKVSLTNYENSLPEVVIIFGNNYYVKSDNNTVIGVDVIASSFFMLSRWEEYVLEDKDNHQRFQHESAFAFQQHFLHRPVVNEYAYFLKELLIQTGYNGKFSKLKFELIPSHDVDHLRYWKSENQMKRQVGGDVLKRLNPLKALHSFSEYRKVAKGDIKDPYDTFDWLMTMSEKADLQSRFYFLASGKTEHEGNYDIRSKEVKTLMSEIKMRGHIIGIHPSYDSYLDIEMLKSEKEILEDVAGQEITEGRQHYLRFDVPNTWQNWEDVGLQFDSSMNYSGHDGYRCGTANEFSVFNVNTREHLKLKERPLVLMDSNPISRLLNISKNDYFDLNTFYIESSKKYKMPLTVLFHNSIFEMYKKYKITEVYTDLLRKI